MARRKSLSKRINSKLGAQFGKQNVPFLDSCGFVCRNMAQRPSNPQSVIVNKLDNSPGKWGREPNKATRTSYSRFSRDSRTLLEDYGEVSTCNTTRTQNTQ